MFISRRRLGSRAEGCIPLLCDTLVLIGCLPALCPIYISHRGRTRHQKTPRRRGRQSRTGPCNNRGQSCAGLRNNSARAQSIGSDVVRLGRHAVVVFAPGQRTRGCSPQEPTILAPKLSRAPPWRRNVIRKPTVQAQHGKGRAQTK
jgi:hypothetical protein